MIEVCFGDSVKGALTLAQNCRSVAFEVGSVVIGSGGLRAVFAKRKALRQFRKRNLELQKNAVPLGGRREDIVSIPFGLSEGDIASPIVYGDCPRRNYLYSRYTFYRSASDENWEETFRSEWNCGIVNLEKLKSCQNSIRIWLDRTADAQCGLRLIASLLKESRREIHIVELPEKIEQEDKTVVFYSGWGEVEPERFGTFLNRERVLTDSEIRMLSREWEVLQEENAPLRVFENGVVRSVEESYYDNRIRQEFPKAACKVAIIIGNVLGRQGVPTGDAFVARRIQQFIHSGELIVVEPAKGHFYSAVVRSASG